MRKLALSAVLMSAITLACGAASAEPIKIRLTAGEHVMTATLENNATSRAFAAKLPLTLPMMDLYGREMCYRFREALPAEEVTTSGYDVGDIVYWTPRHSFVIMYGQNGEVISSLQKLGRIDKGVEVFNRTGDVDVKFELIK
ncbi:cyclophilin-like fold protein [Sutterella sp.]|uniref:cyclophilin-like fold protein n=1 Tax=Sutterella sp. TaxID=1981025 RepID=UPI0026DFE505|nr:cyclophilin-like fold protein [Sutterella sp.]MDO5530662.1 cyclophilin-like fold protein [Sutterella sp.]